MLHLHVVAGGVGLELAGATVVGDPEAVATLVQVEGCVAVEGDPVVVPAHPLREGALVVAAVNFKRKNTLIKILNLRNCELVKAILTTSRPLLGLVGLFCFISNANWCYNTF